MDLLIIALVVGATFGLCFLVDKGFTKIFRSRVQHQSGLSVRLNKKYGAFGLIIAVVGLAAVFTGIADSTVLLLGGIFLLLIGIALVIYYMTFGVYYDEDTFILTTFGKKSAVYRFRDIKSQQLYNSYGTIIIELHLCDGRSAGLQSGMPGVYSFLDHAFSAWCRQTGRDPESCHFHDPSNSLWFPTDEV